MANDKTIKINVASDISNFLAGIDKIQDAISQLDITKKANSDVNKIIVKIKNEIDALTSYVGNNELRFVDSKKVKESFDKIQTSYNNLLNTVKGNDLLSSGLKEDNKQINLLIKATEAYDNALKKTQGEIDDINDKLQDAIKIKKEYENTISVTKNQKKAQNRRKLDLEEALKGEENKLKLIQEQAKERAKNDKKYNNRNLDFKEGGDRKDSFFKTNEGKALIEEEKAIQKLREEYKEAVDILERMDEARNKSTAEATIKQSTDKLKILNEKLKEIKENTIGEIVEDLKKGGFDFESLKINPENIKSVEDLNQLLLSLQKTSDAASEELKNGLDDTLDKTGDAAKEMGGKIEGATTTVEKFEEEAEQLARFKKRLLDFFGIDNAVRLFRRALQSSFRAIKELDAAMTEMAVVTKLDVGDYWDQLPEYTQRANDLGIATKSAYEAATLYYQQGLKTKQVVELSIPTLRMARIAGLDAAEATDRMTNALRGFNMELNETNANRVADVYSKLAAITASNVDEISTAMTKTASIASNAGMAFETTAAFLSQIIETTRESAETAGTALKTVIARFQELKKDPKLIGEVDGEVVDANKIETALRTVGVALRDSAGQFRNLDEVFMELAEKWDSLDVNTQRYIATIAAGSRQQSRFIAMMSNYQHTVELVNAANASAGASTEQFEKTLDSLESKLAKLKNAWDQFTMGLANSDVIKFGVDLLTNILNGINDLTKGWDNASSSVLKFIAALSGLKIAKGLLTILSSAVKSNILDHENLKDAFTKAFGNHTWFRGLKALIKGEEELTVATLSETAASKLQNKVTTKKTALIYLENAALKINLKLLAAYLGITLAVVAAIWLIVKAFKAMKAATPEGRLEAAKKATKEAAEAAQRAAEAYNNLNDSLDNLKDKYENIKELTANTKEWYSAILDTNNEVLKLINQYPELSKYMEIGSGGLLTIDFNREEVQNVLDMYQKRVFNAQLAETQRRLNQQDIQDEVNIDALSRELKVSATTIQQIVNGFKTGQIIKTENGFVNKTNNKELDKFMSALDEAGDGLLELYGKLHNASINRDNLYNSAETVAYGAVKKEGFTSEQLGQMEAFLGEGYLKGLVEKNKIELTGSGVISESQKQEMLKQYADTYYGSLNPSIVGDSIKYALDDSVETVTPTLEELIDNSAMIKSQEELTQVLEKLPTAISDVKLPEIFKNNLFNGKEGNKLTAEDLEMFDAFKEMGGSLEAVYENSKAIQEIYGTFEEFSDKIYKDIEFANKRYNIASQKLNQFNIELPKYISTSAVKVLSDNFEAVFRESGEEGINAIWSMLEPIYENLNSVGRDEVLSFTSALTAITWTSEESIDSLSKTLNELGLEAYIGADKILELERGIDKFANATNNSNLEKLNSKLEVLGNSISKVSDNINNNTNTYDKATRDDLIEKGLANYGDFSKTLEGEYVYLGSQVTLLQNIYDEVSRILKEQQGDIERDITEGKKFGEVYENDKTSQFTVSGKNYTLQNLVNGLVNDTISIDALTEEDTNKLVKLFNLQGTDLESILADLRDKFTKFNNVGTNEQKLNELRQDQNYYKYAVYNNGQDIIDNSAEDRIAAENALTGLIKKSLGYQTATEETTKSLEKQGSALSKNNLLMKAHAKDTQDARKAFEQFQSDLNEYIQAIEDGKDGYAEFEAMENSFAATFGESTREFLTPELIHDNIQMFQNMMNEDLDIAKETFEKIQEKAKNIFKNTDEFKMLGDDFATLFEEFEKSIPLEGSFDITPLMQAITTVADYGTERFEQLKDLIETAFNIKVNIDAESEIQLKADDVDTYTELLNQNYKLKEDSLKDGMITMIKPFEASASTVGSSWTKDTKGTAKTLENQYDWLYNITTLIEQRNKEKVRAEKEYSLLLKNEHASMKSITDSYEAQEASLRSQAILQQRMLESRESELQWIMAQYADVGEYAKHTGERVIIDWKKIDAVRESGNEELMERIDDYISQLKFADDERSQAIDALYDIETTLQNMREQLAQAYLSMEKRVQDAIIHDRQSQIDRQQEILDAYADANSDLIDCINKNISKLRQDRENDKTERNISTLEQRRAYLIASGASAKEIKQIDEQLNEAKENYTDSLIDQAINNLEEYNEQAVDQRQRMIDLAQSQLEWDKENGVIANQAYEKLVKLQIDEKTGLLVEDENSAEVMRILQNAEDVGAMSLAQSGQWHTNLVEAIKTALLAHEQGTVTSKYIDYEEEMKKEYSTSKKINDTIIGLNNNRTNKILSGEVQKIPGFSSWSEKDKKAALTIWTMDMLEEMFPDLTKGTGLSAKGEEVPEEPDKIGNNPTSTSNSTSNTPQPSDTFNIGDKVKLKDGVNKFATGQSMNTSFMRSRDFDVQYVDTANRQVGIGINGVGFTGWVKFDDLLKYAQGGLADFTGPAWLDGTKSKPEVVLNAADSANFIQLRDILRNLLPGITNTNTSHDAYFNFEVNVDQLASDYDVEQLAQTVKTIINREGAYRNVNNLSRVR